MNPEKLQRTPNFTPIEKEFLLRIIEEKYQNVLEDKNTNRVSIQEKNQIWIEIENEFNNRAPIACFRSSDQLKRLYENKKKELRKKMADNKKQTFLTGGGPPPNTKFDPTDEILIRILNEKTVKGLDVPFDCDSFEPVRQKQDVVFEFSPSPIEFTRDHELLEENSNIEVIAVVNDNDSKLEERDNRQSQKKKYPPLYLQSPMSTELKYQQSSSKSSGTPSNNSNPENPQPRPQQFTRTYKTTPKSDSSSSRRRPTNGIKILTSSDVSEKYNILLDRRLVLVEKQIEQVSQAENFAREEQKEKLKIMNQQQENLNLEKEEKKLKIELLKLDLNYKRSLLSNI